MTEKPWQGVFEASTDVQVEQFTESISFDHRLYLQDIAGSIAHAQALAKTGLLTQEEADQIQTTLLEIQQEIASGQFEYKTELEDIHMHVERALTNRLGDVGRKLHTARSRNDQVSTDLRLWIRGAIDRLDSRLLDLQKAWIRRAVTDHDIILPGYTHMRRAQPVLAAHYYLAYCEKFARDRDRLADCRKRVNCSPLGTAALAGTSLPIDRQETATRLGFASVVQNSLDASSDRDFALEFAFCSSVIATHLSGWAEEWILWSTTEFDYLRLPQEYCTGSSIMPQKINPDVLELVRGKTARVVGNLTQLFVLLKGLPLAYNRDLQEDKLPIFDCFETVDACLAMAALVVEKTVLNVDSIQSRLEEGYLDATSLMERLILRGIPQRKAHEISGKLTRLAMQRGVALSKLSLGDFQSLVPQADESLYEVLGTRNSVNAFASVGSTSPTEVRKQVDRWSHQLGGL